VLSNLGNIFLIMSILFTILIVKNSYATNLATEKKSIRRIFNYITLQATFTIMTLCILIFAFIVSDFSISNVFENSHVTKPLFYKITGSWGNHEGSLLLWINVLVIFSFFFFIFNKTSNLKYKYYTLIIQNILILGFLFFLLFNSNPFSPVFPTPKEGLGLNPILQDPALAIHPPLLYIGFVGSSIYFSAALSSLLSGFTGAPFAKSIKPWVLLSWSFQTVGILVGSIWAYYELGWGGFWFWDPVENASLIPWFVMTALLHSIVVLEKRETLYSWVIILCLLTFISSVTGTFLVRSGILNSVHTFANDPSRGLYILIFLTIMIMSSFYIYLRKNYKDDYIFNLKSKETFILTNNWFMLFYLATVLIGTLYPIFTEVVAQTKISVGPPFYHIVIIPILIPFLIFMGIGPNSKWIKGNIVNLVKFFIILISAIIINSLIFFLLKGYNFLSNLLIISTLFLCIHSISDFIKSYKSKKFFEFSRIVSHLGFGSLIFFITLNSIMSTEEDFNLKIGESKSTENFEIKFNKIELKKFKNFNSIVGNFEVFNEDKNSLIRLEPEIRIYDKPEILTYEASIKSDLFQDYFITMSNLNRSEFYNIKFQHKPFMIWIWLSALMLPIGGALRLLKL
tara:strand:+ start:2143 stop:4017 length:1875 start_codon:yes stop_codon:yes gene_type:complete